mmetsp:Transcript_8169/g.13207  ORF Transcript_8169/g.13207 Transcript_8169/m.13207 type:complete len:506 (+) Transcript_8169:863-2380(+)|eukprot:CAMPEP_0184654944 /NCGR_PEP_ID=MMETSP0308-20130426/12598_1 /TAXON_ID=38269 /ORGANISM="Gloeochaete witrockiana, Strain SAG 46.84" /LENGTH=505 /DNA_ID=CAMNT_0027091163 /DNA_START=963 /DNA_END=2480 /DNA_ORIENTATION=-
MSGVTENGLNGSYGHGQGAAEFNYHTIIIGGGSGGLACSKELTRLGCKVAVFDYVTPSPPGTTWGLGGTCVNVGCIPKKLFHQASELSKYHDDAAHYGWKIGDGTKSHDWTTLVTAVQNHIGSLNWGYRVQLREKKVDYFNALASFVDQNTIKAIDKKGMQKAYTAQHFVIAVGTRPKYPDIPGAIEYGITSDDLFSLQTPPGKTLVVGASYVALECAGFLTSLGYQTKVMARSIFLRGFDQELAEMIALYMEDHGTGMIRQCIPTRLDKLPSGRINVTFKHLLSGIELHEEFDTVLFAIGREAVTGRLNLDAVHVKYDLTSMKIPATNEQTNVPNIFAIGDVLLGRPELTPVAIQAGKLLARRITAASDARMDYDNVPTTVFTPLEYGCCGSSEEDAITRYGEENVEVYHSFFKPLEWTVAEREDNRCFAKIIVHVPDNNRVVGFHILSPNAGEVTQGYAVAMRCGLTKEQLDSTIGIHPTIAEEFTTLRITKRSGEDAKRTGC